MVSAASDNGHGRLICLFFLIKREFLSVLQDLGPRWPLGLSLTKKIGLAWLYFLDLDLDLDFLAAGLRFGVDLGFDDAADFFDFGFAADLRFAADFFFDEAFDFFDLAALLDADFFDAAFLRLGAFFADDGFFAEAFEPCLAEPFDAGFFVADFFFDAAFRFGADFFVALALFDFDAADFFFDAFLRGAGDWAALGFDFLDPFDFEADRFEPLDALSDFAVTSYLNVA